MKTLTTIALTTTLAFTSCKEKQTVEGVDPSKAPSSSEPATIEKPEADNAEKFVADSVAIINRATAAARAGDDKKAGSIMDELKLFEARAKKLGIDPEKNGNLPEPLKQKLHGAMSKFFKAINDHEAKKSDEPNKPDTPSSSEDGDTPEQVIVEMIKNYEQGTVIVTALAEGIEPEANTAKFKAWKKTFHSLQGRMQKFDKELDDGHSERAKKLRDKYATKIAKAFGDYGHASIKALNSNKTPAAAKTLISQP